MDKSAKYKYILFDWDGTLLNSIPTWISGIRLILRKYSLSHLTDREIALNILNSFEDIDDSYGIPDLQLFRSEIYTTDPVVNLHLSDLHEGTEETLKFLHKKDIPMGIVTTSDRSTLENALSHHGLNKYFKVLITRQDVTNRKPHPEPVLKAIEKLGCDVPYTLYVGDSHHDTKAGKAARVKTALHYPRLNEKYFDLNFVRDSEADYILHKLSKLHSMI